MGHLPNAEVTPEQRSEVARKAARSSRTEAGLARLVPE